MAIIPKLIARVKSNGKRYFVINIGHGKVYCKGEIKNRSGFSATFGDDKRFLEDRVEITQVDLTEDLLDELIAQEGPVTAPIVSPKVEKVGRKKWTKTVGKGFDKRRELTDYAIKRLKLEGEDLAWDALGNYMNEQDLENAAMEIAMEHYELTEEGVPQFNVLREIAADYLYDGMLKGKKRVIAEGRSLEVPR
jgi:hypothetical protein